MRRPDRVYRYREGARHAGQAEHVRAGGHRRGARGRRGGHRGWPAQDGAIGYYYTPFGPHLHLKNGTPSSCLFALTALLVLPNLSAATSSSSVPSRAISLAVQPRGPFHCLKNRAWSLALAL